VTRVPGEGCVLIVDDDQDGRDALRAYLEAAGHKVIAAADGAEALAIAAASEPDVIVTDLTLAEVDGLTLAQRIRADPHPEYRPFLIAYTGWGRPVDHAEARAAGFDAVVVKPAPEALLRLIESARA
jgi:CheY-like chemotaxis protein